MSRDAGADDEPFDMWPARGSPVEPTVVVEDYVTRSGRRVRPPRRTPSENAALDALMESSDDDDPDYDPDVASSSESESESDDDDLHSDAASAA